MIKEGTACRLERFSGGVFSRRVSLERAWRSSKRNMSMNGFTNHNTQDDGRHEISRRDLLNGGLLLGAAALLAGCQSGVTSASGPTGVVWPDMRGDVKPAPLPPSPAPSGGGTPSGGRPVLASSPGVIPRSEWTPYGVIAERTRPMTGIGRITVHHEGEAFYGSAERSTIARRLANIRAGHIRRRPEPFADIGYHYIIDPAGRVWEGRPLRFQGAHVEKNNEQNMGIMLMGNFDAQRPTAAQLSSLEGFLVDQMRRYRLPANRVYTHQEFNRTACPGRNLQQWMLAMRSPAGAFARA